MSGSMEQSPNQAESDLHMEIERLRAIRGKTLGELEDRTIEVHALRAIRDELVAALQRVDGLNDNPYRFNAEIDEVVTAAIKKAKEQQP